VCRPQTIIAFPIDVTRRRQAVRCRPGLERPDWLVIGRRDVQEGGSEREDVGEEGGSDAESDGYGEAGLTWEAVLQSMQVRCDRL